MKRDSLCDELIGTKVKELSDVDLERWCQKSLVE